jgi:DNA processing protein
VKVVARGEPGYPDSLRALTGAPEKLWIHGDLPAEALVAVVGTRAPDREGRDFARRLGAAIAEAGAAVVSGGALGVDAEAHQGALGAGGRTVAVLGTGIDVVYPREHEGLFGAIRASGALVTELAPGTPPRRAHFPARNRIVAAFGVATVVVQAGARSGSLSTAAVARRLGRAVIAVPWGPGRARGEGTARLIDGGAIAGCSVERILRAVGLRARAPARAATAAPARRTTADEGAILRALADGPLHLSEISDETRLPAAVVVRTILTMTLEKLVEEVDFQRFALPRA